MSQASLWRGRALGVDLESTAPLTGLSQGGPRSGGGRSLRIDVCTEPDLLAGWPAERATRIAENLTVEGVRVAWVDAYDTHGYLFHAPDAGLFRLSSDGTSLLAAPGAVPSARWQRYLISQVLPFAAVLQGIEVFHASAVAVGGEAIGFVGERGVGKSTIALNLQGLGATFLSDDVLGLELQGDRLVAHPSLGVAKVRTLASGLVSPKALMHLDPPFEDGDEMSFLVERPDDAVPLRALCFLVPLEEGTSPYVKPVLHPAFEQLVGGSFNFVLASPARLCRQLDICAAIAGSVECFELGAPVNSNGALARAAYGLWNGSGVRYEIGSNAHGGA